MPNIYLPLNSDIKRFRVEYPEQGEQRDSETVSYPDTDRYIKHSKSEGQFQRELLVTVHHV